MSGLNHSSSMNRHKYFDSSDDDSEVDVVEVVETNKRKKKPATSSDSDSDSSSDGASKRRLPKKAKSSNVLADIADDLNKDMAGMSYVSAFDWTSTAPYSFPN
eukprot:Colp12_sorted_trinity150504_noHs@15283